MKKVWVTSPMIEGQIYRYGEEVDETLPGVTGYITNNKNSYRIEEKKRPTTRKKRRF